MLRAMTAKIEFSDNLRGGVPAKNSGCSHCEGSRLAYRRYFAVRNTRIALAELVTENVTGFQPLRAILFAVCSILSAMALARGEQPVQTSVSSASSSGSWR